MIHVVATVELHPGSRASFLAEFSALTPEVRAEAGCIEYNAYVDTLSGLGAQAALRPDVVIILEKWTDIPALAAHAVAPHMQAYRKRVAQFVLKTSLQVLAASS